MLRRIIDGRTDLVFDFIGEGHDPRSSDPHGTPLIAWCAYYRDVSAIHYLLERGERRLRCPSHRRPSEP